MFWFMKYSSLLFLSTFARKHMQGVQEQIVIKLPTVIVVVFPYDWQAASWQGKRDPSDAWRYKIGCTVSKNNYKTINTFLDFFGIQCWILYKKFQFCINVREKNLVYFVMKSMWIVKEKNNCLSHVKESFFYPRERDREREREEWVMFFVFFSRIAWHEKLWLTGLGRSDWNSRGAFSYS